MCALRVDSQICSHVYEEGRSEALALSRDDDDVWWSEVEQYIFGDLGCCSVHPKAVVYNVASPCQWFALDADEDEQAPVEEAGLEVTEEKAAIAEKSCLGAKEGPKPQAVGVSLTLRQKKNLKLRRLRQSVERQCTPPPMKGSSSVQSPPVACWRIVSDWPALEKRPKHVAVPSSKGDQVVVDAPQFAVRCKGDPVVVDAQSAVHRCPIFGDGDPVVADADSFQLELNVRNHTTSQLPARPELLVPKLVSLPFLGDDVASATIDAVDDEDEVIFSLASFGKWHAFAAALVILSRTNARSSALRRQVEHQFVLIRFIAQSDLRALKP